MVDVDCDTTQVHAIVAVSTASIAFCSSRNCSKRA